MRYAVGDKPRSGLVIVPTRDDEPVDLTGATVSVEVGNVTLAATVDEEGRAIATWPSTSPFTSRGLYPVVLQAEWPEGRESYEMESIVVESLMDGWHSISTMKNEWSNRLNDVQAYSVLSAARVAIEEYGWTGAGSGVNLPPLRARQAQLLQARNIYNAAIADPANRDAEGNLFITTPFPLDHNIRQILRPRRAVPVVG